LIQLPHSINRFSTSSTLSRGTFRTAPQFVVGMSEEKHAVPIVIKTAAVAKILFI